MMFEQALHMAGLLPRAVVADGKWRRCATVDKPKKRNGAFILYSDGRGYWKNWALDIELNVWRDDSACRVRTVDLAALQANRVRERQGRVQAMQDAREFWAGARPLDRPHKYVADKGLSALGCTGLRAREGLLVVPVWHGELLASVQTIAADGAKRFWPGAPVKAGCCVLDRPRAAITAVVEGLATGLAVFQSLRQSRVIVAFDAGNLLPVVGRLKPTGSVVIAADNDHGTEAKRGVNPGLEAARAAAELIGCGVAYPKGIEGTDWADFLREVGESGARKMERLILAQARYVVKAAS